MNKIRRRNIIVAAIVAAMTCTLGSIEHEWSVTGSFVCSVIFVFFIAMFPVDGDFGEDTEE